MDHSIAQIVSMWQMEAAVAVSVLVFVVLYHRYARLWMAREGVSLVFILGFSLAIVTVVFLYLRDRILLFHDRNALLFMLLFCWCALGTWFVAARHTHALKLTIGIIFQGFIIYSLYKWV